MAENDRESNDARRIERARKSPRFIDLTGGQFGDPVLTAPANPIGSIGPAKHQIPVEINGKVYYLAAHERGT